jgi:hypothetical protein
VRVSGDCQTNIGHSQARKTQPSNQWHDNNSSAPVAGANSFTKGEAVKQIEAKGLHARYQPEEGQERCVGGKATKDGHSGPVRVDYQGNVN